MKCRRLPSHPPSRVQFDRQSRALARHPRPPLRPAILVLEIAHVLAASQLGAILCGMDLELSPCATGQHQHSGLDRCLRSHHCAGIRGVRSCVGARDEEAYTDSEAGEGTHGIQRRTAVCSRIWREEGALVCTLKRESSRATTYISKQKNTEKTYHITKVCLPML